MPIQQQWVYTDVVSGETDISNTNTPPIGWSYVGDDHHGPKGLYIIAQRMITAIATGHATYTEATSLAYGDASGIDSGYQLPPNFFETQV